MSNLIQEVCEILDIKKVNTSVYHPQTDGLVEKFNSTLINMLSKCAEKHSNWDTYLPFLLFAYRSTVQDSVKEYPFYLLYGRDPRIPSEEDLQEIPKYPSPHMYILSIYAVQFMYYMYILFPLCPYYILVAYGYISHRKRWFSVASGLCQGQYNM